MNDNITSQVPSPSPSVDDLDASRLALVRRATRKPRLWPAVAIVILMWLAIKLPAWIAPGTMMQFMAMMWAPLVGGVLMVLWWLFFSRIPWTYRLLGLFAFAASAGGCFALAHVPDYYFRLMLLLMLALPVVMTAGIVWLVLTPFLSWSIRLPGLLLVFVATWGYFDLLRFDGIKGDMHAETSWRWAMTAEQKYLAEVAAQGNKTPSETVGEGETLKLQPGDWPGFRGANRDARLTGVRINTDWDKNPPRQVWKHRIGPGWSSFCVIGDRLYTQEQLGTEEVVSCCSTNSGEILWSHKDTVRFEEPIAGAGPRATPTFHEGKIFALGAKGLLNCLDAATGKVVWSRDIVADSGAKVPMWGFASSPLVAHGIVSVFAGGPNDKSVLGYSASSGELVWSAGKGKLSYGSPHPATLDGVEQLLIATDAGLTALQPKSGEVLWQHSWQTENDLARIVQPTVLDETGVLIGTGMGVGTRRLQVKHEDNDWKENVAWTSQAIKPYYNDMVAHKDYLYGFDNSFFTCVSLKDGKKQWRERGYGNGQVLLLADQDLLLILSEEGEVALVETTPQEHKERARFKALEGKTWNHPVVAHGKLFVRNGEEIACYQLTEEKSK